MPTRHLQGHPFPTGAPFVCPPCAGLPPQCTFISSTDGRARVDCSGVFLDVDRRGLDCAGADDPQVAGHGCRRRCAPRSGGRAGGVAGYPRLAASRLSCRRLLDARSARYSRAEPVVRGVAAAPRPLVAPLTSARSGVARSAGRTRVSAVLPARPGGVCHCLGQ